MTTTGHNSRATALREAARFILACDQEVKDVNERKKDFFKELRGSLPDEDIKALKSAIKVYRDRLRDLEGAEAHDSRVWDVLSIIEASNDQPTEETAPRATPAPANGHPEETASTRAHMRVSREAIQKQALRMRMEDHVALSDELASAGMISPEAAEENRVIAQSMNRKFGDGKTLETVDLETGEILTPPDPNDPGDIPPAFRRRRAA